MFAATAVAVVARSVVNETAPDMTLTPSTVMLSTEPAAPETSVTVPLAGATTGVRSVTTELLAVSSSVKRSILVAPPEWQ